MVGYNFVIGNVEIEKFAQSRIGTTLQNLILFGGVVVAKADSKAHNIRVEIALRLECNVFVTTL